MGRVNHSKVLSGQMGADPERVNDIMKKCEYIYLEMDPGDALFHHGNTLHRSDENKSKNGRLGFLSCFNGTHNSPVFKTGYPSYNKLEKVPNEAIKQCTNYTDFIGKGFRDEGVNNMKRKPDKHVSSAKNGKKALKS